MPYLYFSIRLMPLSFWIISVIVFFATAFTGVSAAIRYYRKELKHEWSRQPVLNAMTIVRAALPLCLVITTVVMLGIRYLFY